LIPGVFLLACLRTNVVGKLDPLWFRSGGIFARVPYSKPRAGWPLSPHYTIIFVEIGQAKLDPGVFAVVSLVVFLCFVFDYLQPIDNTVTELLSLSRYR
jgi:hypothetical protein